LKPSETSESTQPPVFVPSFNGHTEESPFPEFCEFPLLQLDPVPHPIASFTGCSLEQAYPDVAKNLHMFEQSVVPKWRGVVPEQRFQDGSVWRQQEKRFEDVSVPRRKETDPEVASKLRFQAAFTPTGPEKPFEEAGMHPFPLLTLPEEGIVDIPNLFQVPVNHQPLPHQPPSCLSPSAPSRVSTQAQPPAAHPQPFFLVPFSSQIIPQSLQFPPLLNAQPTLTPQHESHPDYQLPNVPLKPFTPILIPNEPQHVPEHPELLRLDDPLTTAKENGLDLLKMEEMSTSSAKPGRNKPSSQEVQVLRHTKLKETRVSAKHRTLRAQESLSDSSVDRKRKKKMAKKTTSQVENRDKKLPSTFSTTHGALVSEISSEVENQSSVDVKVLQRRVMVENSEHPSPTRKQPKDSSSEGTPNTDTSVLKKPYTTMDTDILQQRLEVVKKSEHAKAHTRDGSQEVVRTSELVAESTKVEQLTVDAGVRQRVNASHGVLVSQEAKKQVDVAFSPMEGTSQDKFNTGNKNRSALHLRSSSQSSDFPDSFPPLESLEIRRLNLQSLNREDSTASDSDRVVDVAVTTVKKELSAAPPNVEVPNPSSELPTPTSDLIIPPPLELTRTITVEHSLKSTFTKSQVTVHSPAEVASQPESVSSSPGPKSPPSSPKEHIPAKSSNHHPDVASPCGKHDGPGPEQCIPTKTSHQQIPSPSPELCSRIKTPSPEHHGPIENPSIEQHSRIKPPSPEHHGPIENPSIEQHSRVKTPSPEHHGPIENPSIEQHREHHGPIKNLTPEHRSPTSGNQLSHEKIEVEFVNVSVTTETKVKKNVVTTPTSSVAVQVGFDATPPIDLNFPATERDEPDMPG
jgi:hypothetical protein